MKHKHATRARRLENGLVPSPSVAASGCNPYAANLHHLVKRSATKKKREAARSTVDVSSLCFTHINLALKMVWAGPKKRYKLDWRPSRTTRPVYTETLHAAFPALASATRAWRRHVFFHSEIQINCRVKTRYTCREHESTAEIVVSGLSTRGQLSYGEIVTSIFNFIGANRFSGDVISIRKLNTVNENRSTCTPDGGTATLMSVNSYTAVQICASSQWGYEA